MQWLADRSNSIEFSQQEVLIPGGCPVHFAIERAIKPEGTTVHYVIETKGSTFNAKALAAGLLSALGHNPTIALPDFAGEIFLNPDAVEQSSLRMVINSALLKVADDISEKDREEINTRMHDEVLESSSFPEIVYECSCLSATKAGEGHYWVTLNGELTLQTDKVEAMNTWCLHAGIMFTPTFFVSVSEKGGQPSNYYKLPELYNVADLKYFLAV